MTVKATTPMKRLSSHLSTMKDALSVNFHTKKLVLNKAEANSGSYHNEPKKGVNSDFIAIFKFHGFQESFSFVFSYMDENSPQTFFAQIKTGEDNDTIITSAPMNFEDFRIKLNQFNKFLTTITVNKSTALKNNKNESFKTMIQAFTNTFISETLTDSSKELIAVFDKKVADKYTELKIDELTETSVMLEKNYHDSRKMADEEYSCIDEIEELKKLEAKLNILKRKMELKRKAIDTSHELAKNQTASYEAKKVALRKVGEFEVFKSKLINEHTPMIRTLIKNRAAN